jgi:hypothetical protein
VSDVPSVVTPFRQRKAPMFQIMIGAGIKSAFREEFMIKGLVPHQGFGVLYGASQSLKSFVALDIAYRVALGEPWGARRVVKADTIYVAAEGMGGMAKRVEGIRAAHPDWPGDVPSFGLLCGCPSLGLSAPRGDLAGLVDSIETSGLRPRLIVLDTLAQMLCGADENGARMTAFVRSAQALSHRFGCFVLAVRHIGHAAEQRLRGHSSLPAAADLIIRADRLPDAPATTLAVEKAKDSPLNVTMTVNMRRIVLDTVDGDEISTLVVDSISDGVVARAERRAKGVKAPKLATGAKVALHALKTTIKDHGSEAPVSEHVPAGAKVVPLDRWREAAIRSGMCASGDDESKRRAFSRAFDKLRSDDRIGVCDDLVWLAA